MGCPTRKRSRARMIGGPNRKERKSAVSVAAAVRKVMYRNTLKAMYCSDKGTNK